MITALRRLRHPFDPEAIVWCPQTRTLRIGVRRRDGSIDCPCGINTTAGVRRD